MAATTNEARLTGFEGITAEQTEPSVSVRHFQNSVLSELPGFAFAFLTLAYITFSLIGL